MKWLWILAFVGLLFSESALADTLPPATYTVGVTAAGIGQTYGSGPTPITCASVPTGSCLPTETVQGSATPGPLTVSISGTGSNTSGSASILYYFRVDGPANTLVTYYLGASGAASASGSATVDEQLGLGSSIVGGACASGIPDSCGSVGSSFAITPPERLSIKSDTMQSIFMEVSGGASGAGGNYSGSIDPMITIDPTFLAEGFTLQLSPNVSQDSVSATPLPAALPLFATGLGAMGALGWRRKRKNTAAIVAA